MRQGAWNICVVGAAVYIIVVGPPIVVVPVVVVVVAAAAAVVVVVVCCCCCCYCCCCCCFPFLIFSFSHLSTNIPIICQQYSVPRNDRVDLCVDKY